MSKRLMKIQKAQRRVLNAQHRLIEVTRCVDTDEYKLARWKFWDRMEKFFLGPSTKDELDIRAEEIEKINIQRALIRAQVDLLQRNQVYGDM